MDLLFFEGQKYLAEVDVYWVQYGGGDPSEWIRKLAGRVPLVHMKDLGMVEGKQWTMEVGEGNMNFREILSACRDSSVEWFVVELDDCIRDSLDALRISKQGLERAMAR
jgi:sugar phosphate isomerase/epimerase